jgi:peptidoglycan/xylan/chitin deacetylase (PgdA/CDA1 family)
VACVFALLLTATAVAACGHHVVFAAAKGAESATSTATAVSSVPTGSVAASITAALAGFPTVSSPPPWAAAYQGVIDGVKTPAKVVALTFDDGPTPRTGKIVEVLDRFDAHATFFWIGSHITTGVAIYTLAHGEELANHTWTHPSMKGLTSEEASEQIGWTSARIAQFAVGPPIWFRSPFNRLYTAEHNQVRAHGLLYANYDITTLDWTKDATTRTVLADVDKDLHPGGIILMHDSLNHDPLPYLPTVLGLLKARGYQMVTLSTLAPMGTPWVYELKRFHSALDQGHDASPSTSVPSPVVGSVTPLPFQLPLAMRRGPHSWTLRYSRKKGVAQFNLAVRMSDQRGVVAGATVWLQSSADGSTWANVRQVTTDGSGQASVPFSVKKKGQAYYRWWAPATALDTGGVTLRQLVIVR